jgi:enoyl-CoA hydratase
MAATRALMPNETMYVEREPGFARVVFDKPDQNNPMNDEWRADLESALDELREDEAVAVVVIKGNGRSLTSGGDLSVITKVFGGTAYDDRQNSLRIGRFLYRVLWQYPKPVILQVHGYCIGGGITLMAASDIVVIEDDARIGSPEARALGFEPFLGFWAATLGPRWAKLMLFTGDSIDGRTAEQIGMVTKSVPAGELDSYVDWLAARVANMGYETLSLYKEAINSMFEVLGMEALLKTGMIYNHLAHSTGRAHEFLGKIESEGIREAVEWRDGPFGGPQKRGEYLPLVDGPRPAAPSQ